MGTRSPAPGILLHHSTSVRRAGKGAEDFLRSCRAHREGSKVADIAGTYGGDAGLQHLSRAGDIKDARGLDAA